MSDSESSYDESIDLSSEHFDPLKALYAPKVNLPCPNAKTLDNLAQYASLADKIAGRRPDSGKASKNEPSTSQGTSSEVPVRRFEKYAAAMTPVVRKKRMERNVLTRMQNCEPPFTRLWECCQADPPSRIRVVTRHSHGIRGTLDGYVVAFDKHFNLAMSDVTEIWYRTNPRRKTKLPFLDDPDKIPEEGRERVVSTEEDSLAKDLSQLSISHQRASLPRTKKGYQDLLPGELPIATLNQPGSVMNRPPVERGRGGLRRGSIGDERRRQGRPAGDLLKSWRPLPTVYWRPHGKKQECERHIHQLLVRGEHVVLIQFPPKIEAPLESKKDKETEEGTSGSAPS